MLFIVVYFSVIRENRWGKNQMEPFVELNELAGKIRHSIQYPLLQTKRMDMALKLVAQRF